MIGIFLRAERLSFKFYAAGMILIILGIWCAYHQHNVRSLAEQRARLEQNDLLTRNHAVYRQHMDMGESNYKCCDYEMAASEYLAALVKAEKFSLTEKDLLQATHGLASAYASQGKFEEALPYYRRIALNREKFYGPGQPDTTYSLLNLAIAYDHCGETVLAESAFKRMLSIWEKADYSDNVEISLRNLATFYMLHGREKEARPLLIRLIASIDSKLYSDQVRLYFSLKDLINTYSSSDFKDTEPLILRTIAMLETQDFGADTQCTAMCDLSELYISNGEFQKAKPLVRRIADLFMRSSSDHPQPYLYAGDFEGIAKLSQKAGDTALSKKLNQLAVDMRKIWKSACDEIPAPTEADSNFQEAFYEQYCVDSPDGSRGKLQSIDFLYHR